MTSPSSSVVIRMIPCMAGCAGPTPMRRFWLPLPVPLPSPSMNSRCVVCAITVLAPGILHVIDRGQVRQHLERERRLVAAPGEDAPERLACDHRRVVPAVLVRLDDVGPEPCPQLGEHRRPVHQRLASRSALRPRTPITGSPRVSCGGSPPPRDQYLWAWAAILSWSFMSPSMTDSGRGGQPGM